MTVKLSSLLVEKAKADIQVGGASFGIVFYVMWRDRFTPEEFADLVRLTGREYLKVVLPRVLVSWDFVDDDGHAVPVTAEAIEEHAIPDTLLFACERRALNSDLSGKAISGNSPAT
ncbi:MAG: hypothetical protein NVSMB2_28730 [Chloroflexota bacterium]